MSLIVKIVEKTVHLEFNHGKANEMGSQQLQEFEDLCTKIENGDFAALVSFSTRRSSRGTPIFVAGANVTERVGWTALGARGLSDVTRDIDAVHAFGRVVGARWLDARDATFGEPVGSESDNMAGDDPTGQNENRADEKKCLMTLNKQKVVWPP